MQKLLMMKAIEKTTKRISQGDIFKNIEYIDKFSESEGIIEISKIIFPWIIVLTQDCDLAQDEEFRCRSDNHDKIILSVLVAPIYNAEHVFAGDHLINLDRKMQLINKNKTPGKFIQTNQNPRYHYLDFPTEIELPKSIIDFKHYFSVNLEYLKSIFTKNFVCHVGELYREDISQRFSSYLSRIGLPNEEFPFVRSK